MSVYQTAFWDREKRHRATTQARTDQWLHGTAELLHQEILFIYLFKFISLLFLFYSPVKCSIYNCMEPGRYVIGEIITINMCNLKKLINKKILQHVHQTYV